MVFCGANFDQIQSIKALLVCFEVVSGLKVNLAKSALLPVGEADNLGLADVLGCGMASLSLKYLGLPLGASFKAKSIWDDILEKVDRRLASWKRLYLSKGGRVTLIRSTLSNLPTYFLSLYPIPASVADCLEKLQQDFLWGGLNDEFKYHLVNWNKVCSPISEGVLGIRKLRVFNQALLGKWLWRYTHEREAWWRIVMDAKYGSEWGGWHSVDTIGPHGVGLWRFISRGWRLFSSHTRFDPANGSNIIFWDDVWCGETTLKEAYLGLYNIASAKEVSLADNMDFIGGIRQWNVSFLRLVHDWELEVLASFYTLLYSFRVHKEGEHEIWWITSSKGRFDVRSYYNTLVRKVASPFP